MEKNPFTKQQEVQILKAFDEMDKDLGIDKLDDEKGLNSIWQRYPDKVPSLNGKEEVSWLDRLNLGWVTQIGTFLASPVYVYASFAVIVGLVTVNAFQALHSDLKMIDADPLRGTEVVFQVVDDPNEAARRLSASLLSLGVSYQLVVQPDGTLTLSFTATEETTALLPGRQFAVPIGTEYVVSFEKSR